MTHYFGLTFPSIGAYFSPKKARIVEVWVLFHSAAPDNSQTVGWAVIKIDGVWYLAEYKTLIGIDGKLRLTSIDVYPYKIEKCPKKK